MAKFCKECGKPLDEESKFCKECGAINEDYIDPVTGEKTMAEKAEQEKQAKIDELKKDAAKKAGLVDDEENEKKDKKKLTGGQIALIIIGIVVAIAIIVAIAASSSCGKKDTSLTTATTTTKATTAASTAATKEQTIEEPTVEVWNSFVGTHKAEDTSTLTISGSKSAVKVNISIYKLTAIDMTGTCDDTEITCAGLDPNGGEITARIYLDITESTIVVEFTKSTWDSIPTGTTYEFPAN